VSTAPWAKNLTFVWLALLLETWRSDHGSGKESHDDARVANNKTQGRAQRTPLLRRRSTTDDPGGEAILFASSFPKIDLGTQLFPKLNLASPGSN